MKRIACVLIVLGFYSNAWAVDCDLVYDEFDNVMNKQFLLHPENYVEVVNHRLSRQAYNSDQKGKFLLSPAHKGLGIAVVHTNNNTWGKLLFTWGRPVQAGQPSLIIKKVVLYGRVLDGYRPRVRRNINIASSFTYDLDTGTQGGSEADIWFHNVDGEEMYIEAVNGASLTFPMESLCDSGQPAAAELISPQYRQVVSEQGQLQVETGSVSIADAGKQVLKREILPSGHVLISYSDGSKMERYQGGYTVTKPDGSQQISSFSTAVPVSFPVAPPDANEYDWLDYHRGYLLGIIEILVDNPDLAQQAVSALEDRSSIYASIAARSEIIQQLVLP